MRDGVGMRARDNGERRRRTGRTRVRWLAVGLALALAGCSNHPTANNPLAPPTTTSPNPVETRFAGGQTTPVYSSPASASQNVAGSFDWSDPNGYRFHIAVSFGTPGIADPVAGASTGCAGSDAPPDTMNIPFTLTVTNLLPDRGSALPMLHQDLAGLPPNPHPAGASAAIFETDGGNCGGSLYSVAGFEQNANAVPAGSTVTLQGVIYAVPTPITGAMTFSSLYNSATTIASIPLPRS